MKRNRDRFPKDFVFQLTEKEWKNLRYQIGTASSSREHQSLTLKENPLTRTDLDDFVACYNAKNRHERKESERFKSFSYEELTKRDKLNLDIFWLKGFVTKCA